MKNDANKKSPARKWTLGLMAAGLACGALFLCQQNQASAEKNLDRETVVTAKLLEAGKVNHLLRLISAGQSDAAEQQLSIQLASQVLELQSLLPEVGENVQVTGVNFCNFVIRAEKSHPEQYLAGSPAAQMTEAKEWEAIDNGRFNTQFAMTTKKRF